MKEQMERVHSCLAGPSVWQAGCGLARSEDRGEPLNVYPLHFAVITADTSCYSNDQPEGLKTKSDNLEYSIIAASWSIEAM